MRFGENRIWFLVNSGGNSCENRLIGQARADEKHRFLPSDTGLGRSVEC